MTRITGSEPGFYQDLGELQKIKSNPDQRAALGAAAGQFEVTFLQTVLKHMRAASDALQDEDEKLIKGNELYRDMYDSQLAMGLVKGGGMGLTRQMVEQLEAPLKNPAAAVASTPENLAAFSQPLLTRTVRKPD